MGFQYCFGFFISNVSAGQITPNRGQYVASELLFKWPYSNGFTFEVDESEICTLLTMKPKILRIQIQISFLFSGKVTVYLGKRDFIDGGENVDPIDGVVVVDNDYLRGRKVYGRVTTTYRYGREEDEVMGLKFSKELVLASQQIVPSGEDLTKLTPMQVKRAFVFENLLQNSSFAGK